MGVPAAAVLVVAGAIGAGPVIAAVQGDPQLPELTADQLLTEVGTRWGEAGTVPPMSGTIVETAFSASPALPTVPGGTSPLGAAVGVPRAQGLVRLRRPVPPGDPRRDE